MLKADFHTHSIASPDGNISAEDYTHILNTGLLQLVAVTDHDRIDFAADLHKKLGSRIIVGEEITSAHGEVIGLYLQERVEPHMSIADTIEAIHSQGGLVYIPHPFETVRKGVARATLDMIAPHVDIVEGYNGRAVVQNFSSEALSWARAHNTPLAASSDAHGLKGIGFTYTMLDSQPNSAEALLEQLRNGRTAYAKAPWITLLYPKMNRLAKKFGARRYGK